MKKSLSGIFNQRAFDDIFVRQPDDSSCAVASLATVARLYNLEKDIKNYKSFRKALKTSFHGSSHKDIARISRVYLPVIKSGVNVYHGGIALAYIRYKPSGDDHTVVFLDKKADTIVYYDPADHVIYHDKTSNMRRSKPSAHSAKNKTWTANFAPIPGADFNFWKSLAVKNPYPLRKQSFWIKEHKAAKQHGKKTQPKRSKKPRP